MSNYSRINKTITIFENQLEEELKNRLDDGLRTVIANLLQNVKEAKSKLLDIYPEDLYINENPLSKI